MRRSTGVRLVAVSGILALAATACGGSSGGGGGNKPNAGKSSAPVGAFKFSVDNSAKGPAPAKSGAVKGGVVRIIDQDDIPHLDPARVYVTTYQGVAQMLYRQLNTYRETTDGQVTLVGDLAKDTGKTDDGGKTWTWHLRDNIKWDDGSPITAGQIKYGIERAFAPAYTEGPTYLMEWLTGSADFHKVYDGPYSGKQLDAVQAPDDKTLILKFPEAHPDVPFAAAMTTTAPVRKEKDTKDKYDLNPESNGPYMIKSHVVDKSMVLTKNPNWDPNSDPARYQFADSYEFEFGQEILAINQRLVAANGPDAQALTMVSNVPTELLQQVVSTPDLKSRTLAGLTQFVWRYDINNTRITDLNVRKALLMAFPRQQVLQLRGGPVVGQIANTVLSPTVPGYQDYDLYHAPPAGDPVAAKKILTDAGKLGQTIVHAFPNTPKQQTYAVAIKVGLEKAGFKVVNKAIDSKTYYDEIGKVNNPFDLYIAGWGADWPSASTVIPPTLDGRKIGEQLPNYSHFNDKATETEIDRISAETDLLQAGKDWAALDKKIMEKVPFIPFFYDKAFQLHGPKLGGMYMDPTLGEPSLNGIWVTK